MSFIGVLHDNTRVQGTVQLEEASRGKPFELGVRDDRIAKAWV
jgi:hypothetical protein